jgi:hypothetical protein
MVVSIATEMAVMTMHFAPESALLKRASKLSSNTSLSLA